jgi:hypothetical protein
MKWMTLVLVIILIFCGSALGTTLNISYKYYSSDTLTFVLTEEDANYDPSSDSTPTSNSNNLDSTLPTSSRKLSVQNQ